MSKMSKGGSGAGKREREGGLESRGSGKGRPEKSSQLSFPRNAPQRNISDLVVSVSTVTV